MSQPTLFLTNSFPFGQGESFLLPELVSMLNSGFDFRVLPISPRAEVRHEHPQIEDLIKRTIVRQSLSRRLMKRGVPFGSAMSIGSLLATERTRAALYSLRRCWVVDEVIDLHEDLDYNHIHAYWATAPATIAMHAAARVDVPWSFTAHRGDVVRNHALADKVNDARFVRSISESTRGLIHGLVRDDSGKTEVLRLGVELPTKSGTRNPAGPTLAVPASLLPVKGHRSLISALPTVVKAVDGLQVHLYGDGPLRAELEQQVKDLGLDATVSFEGWIPNSKILERYSSGEVAAVVVPSLDLGSGLHEGIPVSLTEAMAHGIPVISTATGGIPELVTEGAGLLVDAGDSTQLADAIIAVLTNDSLSRRLSIGGRSQVETNFDAAAIAVQLQKKISTFV